MRIIPLIILFVFGQIQVAEVLEERGEALSIFGNLPHRSIGMLWTAHMLLQYRADLAYAYLGEWQLVTDQERLLEGQTRPVVPMYSVYLRERYPHERDFYRLSKYMVYKILMANEKEQKSAAAGLTNAAPATATAAKTP